LIIYYFILYFDFSNYSIESDAVLTRTVARNLGQLGVSLTVETEWRLIFGFLGSFDRWAASELVDMKFHNPTGWPSYHSWCIWPLNLVVFKSVGGLSVTREKHTKKR